MTLKNPLKILLWSMRRNQRDTVSMYDELIPMMRLATDGQMLNFGYWPEQDSDPATAQRLMCKQFADLARLEHASCVLDVGSGLSAPAIYWQDTYPKIQIICVNLSYSQLLHGSDARIGRIAASSTLMPCRDGSADRVLALESAQHFRPFSDFVGQSSRVLSDSGLLVIAMPVTTAASTRLNLGMLNFTWLSEHYPLEHVREQLVSGGFEISKEILIGRRVYGPLARYYAKHRCSLRKSILGAYPAYVESILYHSIRKMNEASARGLIDYVLLRCQHKGVTG